MKIRFVDEAAAEFLDVVSYYEQQQPKLGRRFKEEVQQTLLCWARTRKLADCVPMVIEDWNLRIFPYYIPYIIRGSTLWVVAIAHRRREPEYWIEREKKV